MWYAKQTHPLCQTICPKVTKFIGMVSGKWSCILFFRTHLMPSEAVAEIFSVTEFFFKFPRSKDILQMKSYDLLCLKQEIPDIPLEFVW